MKANLSGSIVLGLLLLCAVVGAMPAAAATRSCRTNGLCARDSYCAHPVGRCEAIGACAPRPQLCMMQVQPVCGCDGHTYSNACAAAARGVSVAHAGRCGSPIWR